jgi:cysteine protease ATG4
MASGHPLSGSSDVLAAESSGARREREVSAESQLSVLSGVSSASSGSVGRRTHVAALPPSSWQTQQQASAGRARASSVDSPTTAAPKARPVAEAALPAASGASQSAAVPPAVPPPVRQRATTLRYHGQIVEPDDGPSSSLSPSQGGSQSGGRTPRNSMYAAFAAETRQPPAAPESQPPSPRERRRLFGRSKTGFGSSRDSLVQTPDGEPAHPSPGRASSLVRRMGSRTFFGGGRNDAAMASTDSLASSTGSAATEGKSSSSLTSKRSGDLLGRTATLPNWVRRKQKDKSGSVSAGSAPAGSVDGRSEGRASIESQASVTEFGRRVDAGAGEGHSGSAGSVGSQSQRSSMPAALAAPDDEPLPRRLSGWLLNMLGTSEAEVARPRAGEPGAPTTRMPAARPTVLTHRGSTGSAGSAPSSSPVLLPAGSAATTAGLTGPPAPGSRKAGLLTSLSSSARQRVGNLDRAVRSLRDGEVAATGDGAAEEGIWLLGVLHGGSAQQQRRSLLDADSPPLQPGGPTIEIQGASPNIARVKSGTAPSSSAGRTSETSSLSSGSAPRRRIRETSPGAESAYSSVLSSDGGVEQHDFPRTPSPTKPASLADSNEEAVIVRNPPTPHSSPNPSSSYAPRSIAAAVSAAGEYAAATALAAVSGPAPVSASESVANAFQHDFASRVWCTYRANFAPISRDGSISAHAEAAAAQAAAEAAKVEASGLPNPTAPSTSAARNERQGTPASAGTPGQRGWLGRRVGEGGSSADLLSTSPTSPHVQQSPGLGAALGVARAVGSAAASPSTSYPVAGGTGGLGERMGIPSLWGRTTAALSATLGVRSDLTRDSGWGCMLRTGQSLLANALLDVHLGREWRRAPRPLPDGSAPSKEEDGGRAYEAWHQERSRYATYVRVLSWFFDDPSPACPFGVHRMAREGKRLGKEPGEWFGPSTAAGAIKQLVDDFHGAGIGVSLAADGVVYLSRARKAAQVPGSHASPHGSHRWQRPVLVLIGVRLGLDGVNPVYHESIKVSARDPAAGGCWLTPAPARLHIPAERRHCRRPTELVVLLRRLPRLEALLSRSAQPAPCRALPASAAVPASQRCGARRGR